MNRKRRTTKAPKEERMKKIIGKKRRRKNRIKQKNIKNAIRKREEAILNAHNRDRREIDEAGEDL